MTPSRDVCVALLARTRSSQRDAEKRCSSRDARPDEERAVDGHLGVDVEERQLGQVDVSPVRGRAARGCVPRAGAGARAAGPRPSRRPDVPEVKWIAPTSEGATDAASAGGVRVERAVTRTRTVSSARAGARGAPPTTTTVRRCSSLPADAGNVSRSASSTISTVGLRPYSTRCSRNSPAVVDVDRDLRRRRAGQRRTTRGRTRPGCRIISSTRSPRRTPSRGEAGGNHVRLRRGLGIGEVALAEREGEERPVGVQPRLRGEQLRQAPAPRDPERRRSRVGGVHTGEHPVAEVGCAESGRRVARPRGTGAPGSPRPRGAAAIGRSAASTRVISVIPVSTSRRPWASDDLERLVRLGGRDRVDGEEGAPVVELDPGRRGDARSPRGRGRRRAARAPA